jgi:hypothetical protein
MDILYPELKVYIYTYCMEFMTDDELTERTAMMRGYTIFSESELSAMREQKLMGDNLNVPHVFEDRHEALKERIVNRIWNEHRLELNLNLCPVCRKVARTPHSRQCQFCFHDWHKQICDI